jgi:nicotinate phosphoribosyltransferase
MINDRIIRSLLDTDLYTFTVGQLVRVLFPEATGSYTFINRSKTKFPSNFVAELKNQLVLLSQLRFDESELNYLTIKHPYLKKEYLAFLKDYQFNPSELEITNEDGNLVINIRGIWYRTIMWEVPLLALISELYFRLTGEKIADDWATRIKNKGIALEAAGCKWMDFGTRRRHSLKVQEHVVALMKDHKGFLGTSNCYLAYLYNVPCLGTMSHQFIMGVSGLCGVKVANKFSMTLWKDFYGKDLLIFLPDTFTTASFLNDFKTHAYEYDGLRQDSGDPEDWMDNKIIPHYAKLNNELNIDLKNKKIIFSDSLDVPTAIRLHNKYKDITNVSFGIGTNFSNDVGVKALSMVIKLNTINGVDVVKLSDVNGKYTGKPEMIEKVKKELGIV